jgi:hypothetical protein
MPDFVNKTGQCLTVFDQFYVGVIYGPSLNPALFCITVPTVGWLQLEHPDSLNNSFNERTDQE